MLKSSEDGDHETPPAALDATVDLSRVDTSIVTHISSFVGTSRGLLSLAQTCKAFGWRRPRSTPGWSVAEESARLAVRSGATDGEMDSLPRYVSGVTTWLSILHAFELPLMFDVLLGSDVEHRDKDGYPCSVEFGNEGTEDKTKVYGALDFYPSSAVVSSYVMRSGSHFAEFQIGHGRPNIGVVRPMESLNAGTFRDGFFRDEFYFIRDPERYNFEPRLDELYSTFLAQRADDWGNGNVHACEYQACIGRLCWTDWNDEEGGIIGESSTHFVGMLLNLIWTRVH